MKNPISLILLILTVVIAVGCSGGGKTSGDAEPTVTLSSTKQSDTLSFPLSNGNNCKVLVDVSVTYPKAFKTDKETAALQRLFITTVLECPDSLAMADAVKQYTASISSLNSTDGSDEDYAEQEEDLIPVEKIQISVNITTAFNHHGVITFCKEVTYKRNDVMTSKMHRYYNLDLQSMKPVDLTMFRDDAISDVCQLLKNKLMEQTHTHNNDELNELGYFNIDNLTVTTNFCFDDNGITWSFLPQELAADALTEPRITISYDALKPLAAEGSIINRF